MMVKIPPEILEQCREGGSLLVKGGPGSGKTILTLSLLCQLKSMGLEVSYVSARLPADSLMRTTELCRELGADSLVDASMHNAPGKEITVTCMPLADLSDLAMIYLKRASPNGVIALDSWDALVQREKRGQQEVYTAMVDLVNRTQGGLVFTVENTDEANPLRHLVDAEIRLETSRYEGNLVRLMSIEKLRGREIETPTYVFTLKNGSFQAHDPKVWALREHPIGAKNPPQPVPDQNGYLSTGMTRLDRILGGGYKRGSYIGIEIDIEAPPESGDLTYLPTASDFLTKDRPVLVVPPGARDPESLWDTASSIFDSEVWEGVRQKLTGENLKVFSLGSRNDEGAPLGVGTNMEDDVRSWRAWKEKLRQQAGSPLLSIVGYDTIRRVYGRDRVESIIGSGLGDLRQHGDLHISLVTSDLEIKDSILGISDYYFRLRTLKDLPVFWGVKPRTGLYTISLESDDGTPKTNLVEVS